MPEIEWVSNDLAEVRQPFATIRPNYYVTLNVVASRQAIQVFGTAGTDPMPSRVWAGWKDKLLVLSAAAIPHMSPFDCRWLGGASPRLAIGLARALQRRGVQVPEGFMYRVPVSTLTDETHGTLLALDMERVQVVPAERRTPEEAAGSAQAMGLAEQECDPSVPDTPAARVETAGEDPHPTT